MRPCIPKFLATATVLTLSIAGCSGEGDASIPTASNDEALSAKKASLLWARAAVDASNKPVATVGTGFKDSSFDYPPGTAASPSSKTFCFLGDVSGVCPAINRAASEMQGRYKGGEHDTIAIKSCATKTKDGEQVVNVAYDLNDDYRGHFDVTHEIAACE
jgi:hypothetical protein